MLLMGFVSKVVEGLPWVICLFPLAIFCKGLLIMDPKCEQNVYDVQKIHT